MKKIIATTLAGLALALGLSACSPAPYYDEQGYYCEDDDMEPGDRGYVDENGYFCELDDDGE
ncbi:hypothetical protein SEA_LOSER_69 [Mycobacterium phage Loser]|uniref:hypothetical protein n=1 Tax=Mycobacterium phage Loser TaxID=1815969 RepID=UPI00078B9AD9|nr:hypothetical protein SEA_LOSER_69 [Mycobacterium phage Loser]AMS00965.1 hypothetical protein SEA_LOSER_69 [Mycobacterium phage Loser]